MTRASLPPPLTLLGLAGIAPQAACLIAALFMPDLRWFAIAAACCYAAVILSFLGGMWWMAALMTNRRDSASFVTAVIPSLIGWGAMLPWCFGWRWPGPSLLVLGVCLLVSPIVDYRLKACAELPPAWLRLRITMAGGLGLTTLALAMI